MAEALVSVALHQLGSILRAEILKARVDMEMENLKLHLSAVQPPLQDAEERQVNEAQVRDWVHDLERVSYQIIDLMDEWNTQILKQIRHRGIPNVCFSPSLCCSQIGELIMHHDIARRIKDVSESLTSIVIEKENFRFNDITRGAELLDAIPEISSFLNVTSGLEEGKEKLIGMLLSEGSHSEQGMSSRRPIPIIPIVGMGGIGKTTLAQLVYEEEKVITNFDYRIWVCVSDAFDEIKIARHIFQALTHISDVSYSLESMLSEISRYICGTRFLLVPDDVWNPSQTNWEPIEKALQNARIGSRIIVTTRNDRVSSMMGATADHTIILKNLTDQNASVLFNRVAFSTFTQRDDESKLMFEDIRNKIEKKCSGLPLGAKILGSLMRFRKTRAELLDILTCRIWELEEFQNHNVFLWLSVSYYYLSPVLRRYLLYCSVFPKQYEFVKDDLIELWNSQQYLSITRDEESERMVVQRYLDNSTMWSFFQDSLIAKEDGNIAKCKVHDIVHDLVQFLSKNECDIVDADEKNRVLDNKLRHLNLKV